VWAALVVLTFVGLRRAGRKEPAEVVEATEPI
jgi:hypothetical protein